VFSKPYIVAELGVNYYDIAKDMNISNMDAAKLMIKEAAAHGANAVKFQSYKAEALASSNSPAYWDISKEPVKSQYRLFKKFDKFGSREYGELAKCAKKEKVDFMSTPFDAEAVDYLDKLVSKFKVASADITNLPLLKKIASKGKPMILSTGASTIKEIREALSVIEKESASLPITLLHCVLSYPTNYSDANLNRIKILAQEFPKQDIGYSDHTAPDRSMLTLTTACLLGAKLLEKHFTLNKALPGNDHYHAMDPDDLSSLASNLNLLEDLLSAEEKNYLSCEKQARESARRSIVLAQDVKKGEMLTVKKLAIKRPGTGIPPKQFVSIIGKKAARNLKKDDILKTEDVE